jgi:two-component system, NtrC family, sensor kinase
VDTEETSVEILIAEDDSISRSLLKKMLLAMGHDVLETQNGGKAWESIRQKPARLIISDWLMPEMDGLELCRKIREASFGHYVYIIILTAKDRKSDLVEVFQSGADDYIPKPFDPEELRARVLTGLRVIDLEERYERMQEGLLENTNKLRILIDSLQEQIVAVDREYQITSANQSFAAQAGIPIEEIIGRRCYTQDHATAPPYLADLQPILEKTFKNGQAQHSLHSRRDAQGLLCYHQIACLPIRNEAGRVIKIVIVSKDITEDRRKTDEIHALNGRLLETAAQLETKNERLESALQRLETTRTQMLQSEKMASIGQLAAGVAHEINNPTGFVSSNLKSLGDYQRDMASLVGKYRDLLDGLQPHLNDAGLPAMVREKIDHIRSFEQEIDIDYLLADTIDLIDDCREGTERIKKIVMDLKDFAHPGNDRIQSTDINKGLESTLNVVHNELKYKATVTTDFGDIPLVLGYPQQLNQVFMNILINAAQAIDKKGDITVKTRTEDGHVVITISDTGCGIAEEHIPKIFDPFFTTKDVGKGSGLGMNIAYNIVRKHNGRIEVQSQLGKGTTMIVRIPAEPLEKDG